MKKIIFILGLLTLISPLCFAVDMNIANEPMFIAQNPPPLTMIVMGRNHKLFYEAYNDASDLNGDGVLDLNYNPELKYPNSSTVMDYYGYFDSHKCYNYNSGQQRFNPVGKTDSLKRCSGNWSGDFLNYVTTSRMDAIRKVLYGGKRVDDTTSRTILQRANIPQDAHSWGKEYTSVAVNGYDISDYTPLSLPTGGRHHLFGNTSLLQVDPNKPLLRVIPNQTARIWEWASIERPVVGDKFVLTSGPTTVNFSNPAASGYPDAITVTEYTVRVKVCDKSIGGLKKIEALEDNCKRYPSGKYKPTGLLHQFGESDTMRFGLLTGSYTNNLAGGVIRKNILPFSDEIDENTGQFIITGAGEEGIVNTIDRIQVTGFGGDYLYNVNCMFINTRSLSNGECRSWGNPIGEMAYEALRYFSGETSPLYSYAGGDDSAIGLPQPSWVDPYGKDGDEARNPFCARPNMLIISDLYPSYDSAGVPGSYFSGSAPASLGKGSVNVTALGQTLWNTEFGTSKLIFIGQSGEISDDAPTAKIATSFGTIRGLAPEEPSKMGSYHTASLAYYGHKTDISDAKDEQKVSTFAVALSASSPQIKIDVNGKTITLLPYAKSVGSISSNPSQVFTAFQATNSLADFYVESITPTSGVFRVNFEDLEQGGDFDMDTIAEYRYTVDPDAGTVDITVTASSSSGSTIQHLGYVISGTTKDGAYIVTRDGDTPATRDVDFELDVPPGQELGGNYNDGIDLPQTSTRTFTPSSISTTGEFLKDPLWFAAKWGGFVDRDNNGLPNLASEWDTNGNSVPDNYFLITNPGTLIQQLGNALGRILNTSSAAAAASLDSSSLNDTTRLYKVEFSPADWSGHLLAFELNKNGSISQEGGAKDGAIWDAAATIRHRAPGSRRILTYKPSNARGIPFRWPADPSSPGNNRMDVSQSDALSTDPATDNLDANGKKRLQYLRGNRSQEGAGLNFRARNEVLGDIIHSSPVFVKNRPYHRAGNFQGGEGKESSYAAYLQSQKDREAVIYVGANDGMLHAFSALDGSELLAFIPNSVFGNLSKLTSLLYSHHFFVDGAPNVNDAFFGGAWHTVLVSGLNKGGKSVYALDITNPDSFTEGNAKNIVLWEFTDDDLGFSYSQPAIVRLTTGKWAAIFGNGYNSGDSGTGNAVLYIVDIKTGAIIRKIDTGVGPAQDPSESNRTNGLATPAIISSNSNETATHVYAGDLFGNLWKFDLSSTNKNNWDVSVRTASIGQPIFKAEDDSGKAQPITVRPAVGIARAKGKGGKVQIYFGTGKYLGAPDKNDLSLQTFYAVEDKPEDKASKNMTRSSLLQQHITGEFSINGKNLRTTSDNIQEAGENGWYMDLVVNGDKKGERSVSNPVLSREKVIFTTLVPTKAVCSHTGTGWLMELNASSGGRLLYSPFDVDGNGVFNKDDLLTDEDIPASGLQSEVGIIPTPGIVTTEDGTEVKYMPGSEGNIQIVNENASTAATKRQSWQQLR